MSKQNETKLVGLALKKLGASTKGGVMTDLLWSAARALYESSPETQRDDIAREFGVSVATLDRRIQAEGWRKATFSTAAMTERAHELADRMSARAAEDLAASGANIDSLVDAPALPEETKQKLYHEFRDEVGAEERARLLKRHREEWILPRNIVYQAVANKDFESAKLAKITTEILKNIQDGERKAWGLDRTPEDRMVVIERG